MLNMMLLNAAPTQVTPASAADAELSKLDSSFANQLLAQLKPKPPVTNANNSVSKSAHNQHTPQEVLIAEPNARFDDVMHTQPELNPDLELHAAALRDTAQQMISREITPSLINAQSKPNNTPVQMLEEIAQSKNLAASMQNNALPANSINNNHLPPLAAQAMTSAAQNPLTNQQSPAAPLLAAAIAAQNAPQRGENVNKLSRESVKTAISMPEQSKVNGAIRISESQLNALQQGMKKNEQVRASMPANAMQAFQHHAQLQQHAVNPQAPLASSVPIKQAIADSPMHTTEQPKIMQTTSTMQPAALDLNNSSNNLASIPQGVQASGAVSNPLVSAPLASAGWQQQIGQQVANMHLRQDNQVALRLHPAELGPLMVNLKMDEQAASLQFTSANPHVRAALEAAMPQLRELLAEQGIQLSDSNVNDGQAQNNREQQSEQQGSDSSGLADNPEMAAAQKDIESQERRLDIQLENGQIDLYA